MISLNRSTVWEEAQAKGISRREFLGFCTTVTAMLGLPVNSVAEITKALKTKPRPPVVWFHFQECTCCSESFLRSSHPAPIDILLDTISLDYTETLMAAAGHQAEEALQETMKKHCGEYLMLVEGILLHRRSHRTRHLAGSRFGREGSDLLGQLRLQRLHSGGQPQSHGSNADS